MNKYTITARSARLTSGQLRLTAEQAKTRLTKLKPLGVGVFEIVQPVEFKYGEVIGYEGDLPKSLADLMAGGASATKKSKSRPKVDDAADSQSDGNSNQADIDPNSPPISSNPDDQQSPVVDS